MIGLDKFKGDWLRPQTWRGLSAADIDILTYHADDFGAAQQTPYFAVPCWNPQTDPLAALGPDHAAYLCACCARRCDLIVHGPQGWSIIEIKPSAAYVALGQVQMYGHLLPLVWPELSAAGLVVATDAPDPALSDLYAMAGIRVLSIPGRTYNPLPRPT